MQRLGHLVLVFCGLLGFFASLAYADPNVQTTDIGANGRAVGFATGAHIKHFVVLVPKGSRQVIYVDGVAGPKIENMEWTGGTFFNANSAGGWIGTIPVLFTPDGEHFTFCYKDGDDTVIMLDGKEIARTPVQTQFEMPLTFSHGGQHIAWAYGNIIYMDGQPGPKTRYQPIVNFSPDGSRYAYTGSDPGSDNQWAVVDGRQVNYFGEINQFSPNNHLISIYSANGASVFVMDGKPEFKAANIGQIWTSPDGKQIAMQITPAPNAQPVLTVNGKIVPGTEGVYASHIYFSPDGKRFAANCSAGSEHFMIIDGKKQDSYQSIPDAVAIDNAVPFNWANPAGDPNTAPHLPSFTADSSKFVYVASANSQNFMMTEDGEFDDYTVLYTIAAISPAGAHYGFVGTSPGKKEAVVIDGNAQFITQVANSSQQTIYGLGFSPDGAHDAFIANFNFLYEDGKQLPGGISGQQYVFSPDGNHLAYNTPRYGVAIDGKILADPGPGHGVQVPLFSSDSQHFYFIAVGRVPNSADTQTLYCDGKAVAHFDGFNVPLGSQYDLTPNGVMTLIARSDGELTKFVVTPDSNLDAALAAAKPAPQNP